MILTFKTSALLYRFQILRHYVYHLGQMRRCKAIEEKMAVVPLQGHGEMVSHKMNVRNRTANKCVRAVVTRPAFPPTSEASLQEGA